MNINEFAKKVRTWSKAPLKTNEISCYGVKCEVCPFGVTIDIENKTLSLCDLLDITSEVLNDIEIEGDKENEI